MQSTPTCPRPWGPQLTVSRVTRRFAPCVLRANMAKGRAVFCAGHDLTHFRETYGTDEEDAVTTRERRLRGITRRSHRKPLIAAVDGLATSGGCEIALAYDMIIASRRAAFALAAVRWNLSPPRAARFGCPAPSGDMRPWTPC